MKAISDDLIHQVIQLYHETQSILETAHRSGLSTVKVRKILITEGLWESAASIRIGNLLAQGLSAAEIAQKLNMTVKNVQAYSPYERGLYGGELRSGDSVRADRYRKRMKTAAAMQVNKGMHTKSDQEVQMDMEEVREMDVVRRRRKRKCIPSEVLRLHLELDMTYVSEEEMLLLKKYGGMERAISRDILVPADITLHALHYAILRMFGWQNSHLHNFSLPEEIFSELTNDRFMDWSALAGVYFRFPTEDYEDIYWDDDYREEQSFKSWLKKKYTGPYRYKGLGEHYLMCQMEVKEMLDRWEEIEVHEFQLGMKKQPKPYTVMLKDATIDQVINAFADVQCEELLERLPLKELLYPSGSESAELAFINQYVREQIENVDIETLREDYVCRRFRSGNKEQEYLQQFNIATLPVTDRLLYRYDYGDGWKVWITCEEMYRRDEDGTWSGLKSNAPSGVEEDLCEVTEKYHPVCIAKDGIELLDDVGGIHGFCDMLCDLYEVDTSDEEAMDRREGLYEWAEMMGWTGRRIGVKQTL